MDFLWVFSSFSYFFNNNYMHKATWKGHMKPCAQFVPFFIMPLHTAMYCNIFWLSFGILRFLPLTHATDIITKPRDVFWKKVKINKFPYTYAEKLRWNRNWLHVYSEFIMEIITDWLQMAHGLHRSPKRVLVSLSKF